MKKLILLITIIMAIALFAGCSSQTEEQTQVQAQGETQQGDAQQGGAMGEGGDGAMQMRGNSVTGLVTDVVGNEITIQVGEMENGGMGEMTQEQRDAMQDGEMPEGMEAPEGAGGGMGEMTQEQRDAMQGGERPEGMEMPEGEGGGRGEGGTAGGGMTGGGMASMEGEDYSEIITLTDEIKTFSVPVTTAVVQFGTEMTFSQITEDMYITVMLDESDNVTSINILG